MDSPSICPQWGTNVRSADSRSSQPLCGHTIARSTGTTRDSARHSATSGRRAIAANHQKFPHHRRATTASPRTICISSSCDSLREDSIVAVP
eukprot:4692671-Prymnesium_polylepis.1